MLHAGHHEETIKRARPSRGPGDALVVIYAVQRRDVRVAPAMVLNQLPAVVPKGAQVGVGGVENRGQLFVEELHVVVEAGRGLEPEGTDIPVRILENDVFEEGQPEVAVPARTRPRTRYPVTPAARPGLASRQQAGIDRRAGTLIQLLHRVHLRGREAARPVPAGGAEQGRRIEVAAAGIVENTVR